MGVIPGKTKGPGHEMQYQEADYLLTRKAYSPIVLLQKSGFLSHKLVCQQVTVPHASVVRGWQLSSGEGSVGCVAQNGESLIVSDTHDDVRHYAISIHDLEGNIIANKRVSAYFGYSRSEILLLNIHDLHPREALEATREAFEQVFKDGFVSFESSFKKKVGRYFLRKFH